MVGGSEGVGDVLEVDGCAMGDGVGGGQGGGRFNEVGSRCWHDDRMHCHRFCWMVL